MQQRISGSRVPKLSEWASVDSVIWYPAKTLFEYLYLYGSSLTVNWRAEEESLLVSRQRHSLIMETLTDQDMRDMIYHKRKSQEDQKLVDHLTWELARRTGKKMKFDPEVDRIRLEEQKANVSILTVIESYVQGIRYRRGSLIKCPMPDHKDWTASLNINVKTWAWKCFGCHKGWGQIDFIMNMEGCTLRDAITKFLTY